MLKKTSLWLGAILIIASVSLMAAERLAVHHLKQELSAYGGGDVTVEGARLYLDGLSVKRAAISDDLVLKNILFGHKAIKHVETLEMTLPRGSNFLEKPLPVGLYDRLNIKFITLHLPFLDDQISINGRLQSKQKSDGSPAYILNFNSQDGDIRVKGTATFEVVDQKISHMAVTLDEGASRYDWLNAKRVTGWWDYKGEGAQKSGELTIGSLEWQGVVLNNAQLVLTDETLTFSADLPSGAGQVDGDLSWQEDVPRVSIAAKINDLRLYDESLTGEGDFQANVTLQESDLKTTDFIGQGDIKGRLKTKGTEIDFNYTGHLQKQGNIVTATSETCLNASTSLTRQGTLLNIPTKECFTLSAPIVFDGVKLQNPVQFKGESIDYALKHPLFNKTVYGVVGNLSGRFVGMNDIALQVKSASLNHEILKNLGGDFYFGRGGVTAKTLKANAVFAGEDYGLTLSNKNIVIKETKTDQKIAELTGNIQGGRYNGQGTFNGPLSLLDKDASAGQAFYNGTIGFNISDPLAKIDGVGILKINEGAFKKGDLRAQGVTAHLQTQSLHPFVTEPNQTVEIKNGQLGSVEFDTATFSVEKKAHQPLTLHSMTLNALGGSWQGEGDAIQSSNISVSSILKGSVFEGLEVTPSAVDGRLSFKINEGGHVSFETGIFKAPADGQVSYNRNRRPQFLNTGSDYYDLQRMRDILQNFQLSKFAIPFDKTGMQGVYMLGTHPKYNKGKPIELDLTVSDTN